MKNGRNKERGKGERDGKEGRREQMTWEREGNGLNHLIYKLRAKVKGEGEGSRGQGEMGGIGGWEGGREVVKLACGPLQCAAGSR